MFAKCDGCPARAVQTVTVITHDGDGEQRKLPLSFCGHHLKKYQQVLAERALAECVSA